MRHTYGHRNNTGRYADHIGFTLCIVAGFNGQIAVGGSQCTLINRNSRIAFRRQTRIPHADTCNAQPCLHRLEMDGIVFIFCHVTLMGRQGHTAAFDGRTGNLYVIQLVQMIYHIRHIHCQNA